MEKNRLFIIGTIYTNVITDEQKLDFDADYLEYLDIMPKSIKYNTNVMRLSESQARIIGNLNVNPGYYVYVEHDTTKDPVGRILKINYNDQKKQLEFSAIITDPIAIQAIKSGDKRGLSISYKQNISQITGEISSVQLNEVSITSNPFDKNSVISFHGNDKNDKKSSEGIKNNKIGDNNEKEDNISCDIGIIKMDCSKYKELDEVNTKLNIFSNKNNNIKNENYLDNNNFNVIQKKKNMENKNEKKTEVEQNKNTQPKTEQNEKKETNINVIQKNEEKDVIMQDVNRSNTKKKEVVLSEEEYNDLTNYKKKVLLENELKQRKEIEDLKNDDVFSSFFSKENAEKTVKKLYTIKNDDKEIYEFINGMKNDITTKKKLLEEKNRELDTLRKQTVSLNNDITTKTLQINKSQDKTDKFLTETEQKNSSEENKILKNIELNAIPKNNIVYSNETSEKFFKSCLNDMDKTCLNYANFSDEEIKNKLSELQNLLFKDKN